MTVDLRSILASLPKREGVPDREWFVGRRLELNSLEGLVCGRQQSGSCWIHGPRRVGKTALSDRISELDVDVLRLSVAGKAVSTASDLYDAISAECGQNFGELRRQLRTRTKPLIVVVDEFDELSLRLSRDSQAELRALAHDHPKFAWVFISRVSPIEICQKFDEHSWLAGICTSHLIKFFDRYDVEDLVQRLCDAAKWDDADKVTAAIWERVAGYPVAVVELLRRVLASRITAAEEPRRAQTLASIMRDSRAALEADLLSLWSDLPLRLRVSLLEPSTPDAVERLQVELNMVEGDGTRAKAWWIVDAARQRGLVPERGDLTDPVSTGKLLGELVYTCNELCRHAGETPLFRAGDRVWRLQQATQPPRTEADLRHALDLLHQILCESTPSGPTERLPPGKLQTALLAWRQSEAYEALVICRNFQDHEPSLRRHESKTTRIYADHAAICREYLTGGSMITSEGDRLTFHRRLLESIDRGLRAVIASLAA